MVVERNKEGISTKRKREKQKKIMQEEKRDK
jgi:hypothetical protein